MDYATSLVLAGLIAFANETAASFHEWTINEIYSNADGSVQFIELACAESGETFLRGERIYCSQNNRTNIFTFPDDLIGDSADKRLILATPGFGMLPGGVTPDYTIPANFLFAGSARLNYANVDILTYTNLPSNGTNSLVRSTGTRMVTRINSPENYARQLGSLVPVRILAIARNGTNSMLSFATVSGKSYTVQLNDGLTNTAWQSVPSVIGNGTIRTVTNNTGMATGLFYRLRVP